LIDLCQKHKPMKKTILTFGLLLFLAVSCRKEEQIAPFSGETTTQLRTTCFDGLQRDCNGEILVFADEAQFLEVYECLEQQYEAWNDAFEQQHASLNDDDFNALADSLGFEEDSTLIVFEQQFPGFVSQRSKLRALEAIWLNNTVLDPATNPFNNDYLNDVIMQTMFNQHQEVRIGNRILHISEIDGSVYLLEAGYCDLLATLRNDPTSLIHNSAVTSYPNTRAFGSECESGESEQGEELMNSNEKFWWKLSFYNYYMLATSAKGNLKYYKQRNNGTWKKHKKKIAVDVYGTMWNWDCEAPGPYSKYQLTLKRRSQRDVSYIQGGPQRYKTKNKFAKGTFYLNNRSTYWDKEIDWEN
jgi:hypothetical protein